MNPQTPALGTIDYSKDLLQRAQNLGVTGSGVNSLQQTLGAYTPRNTDTTISTDVLGQTSPYKIPPIPISTGSIGLSELALSDISMAGLAKQQQEKITEATAQSGEDKSGLKDTMARILGLQSNRGQEEEQAGIPQLGSAVDEATIAYEASQRAEMNELRALETAGMTSQGKAAATRDIQRKYAFERADRAIELDVAERRLDRAQKTLDRKYELQMEPLKKLLEYQMFFYEDNREDMTKAQERQFQVLLENTRNQVQSEADEKKAIYDMAKQAGANGAPGDVVTRISNAKTQQEAIQAAQGFVADPLDREIKLLEKENQRLVNEKLRNEIVGSGDGSEENADNLVAYASQFADTGKLPSPAELKLAGLSVGDVTKYAKQVPRPEGSLVSNKTGVKSGAISPAQEDGILALYDISKKTAELKELETKRVKGLTSAGLGKLFGANDQQNYLDLRTEIIDLLSRARTGAALTASEEEFYKSQLPGRIGQVGFGLFGANTQNKINNFESKINGTLKTKLNGQDMSIYGYSKVTVGGKERTVGEILDIGGVKYRVLPDGTLTDIF